MIDKNAMRYMKQRYFGYTDELNDVQYLRTFLGSHAQELKGLNSGEFLYYCTGKVERISIEPHRKKIMVKA